MSCGYTWAAVLVLVFSGSDVRAQPWLAAVATDNAEASRVGAEILGAGGNAVDAAVASSLMLGLLNPFASGIGGGGFALVYDAESDETFALDFRETCPAGVTTADFADAPAEASRRGGLAVAVPGEIAGLHTLHERFGRLPWADVVAPVLGAARDGFPAGELLVQRLDGVAASDFSQRALAPYRVDDGWVAPGDVVVRSDLAAFYQLLATDGADAFYAGPVATDIIRAVNESGGRMTLDDLQSYRPVWREPVTIQFQGVRLHQMPLPSSGSVVFQQVLSVFESVHVERLLPWSTGWFHRLTLAWGFAFADRAVWAGDPEFIALDTPPPWLTDDRLRQAESHLSDWLVPDAAVFGPLTAVMDDDGTSHLSIVDGDGNAVALTTTINTSFGSWVSTPEFGILLNNEMDDFAVRPGEPNAFGLVGNAANAPEPGKRPLSSMSPTLVFDASGLRGAIGASGGPQIITSTMQVLLAVLTGDHPEQAVTRPRIHFQWLPFTIFAEPEASVPTYLGVPVQTGPAFSAVQIVWRADADARSAELPVMWNAASDPRKLGAPAGI